MGNWVEEVEFLYQFNDPCVATQFVPEVLPDVSVFMGITESTFINFPELADTVSVQYQSNVNQACFTQGLTLVFDPILIPQGSSPSSN
jgi:hypothetical protein